MLLSSFTGFISVLNCIFKLALLLDVSTAPKSVDLTVGLGVVVLESVLVSG